jgi:hypothetical protein
MLTCPLIVRYDLIVNRLAGLPLYGFKKPETLEFLQSPKYGGAIDFEVSGDTPYRREEVAGI